MGYLIKLLIKEGIHIVIFPFKINHWGTLEKGPSHVLGELRREVTGLTGKPTQRSLEASW